MFANTKQVRAIGKAFAGVAAQWTEKTSIWNEQRRSVVWCFDSAKEADALAQHLRANCTNKVTRTGVAGNWATQQSGGQYVRVIADVA